MHKHTSVSKGVFVSCNGFNVNSRTKSKSKTKSKKKINDQKNEVLYDEMWYKYYTRIWGKIEEKLESLNHTMFSKVLEEILSFVKQNSIGEKSDSIPTAAVLTGINLPDHGALFKILQNEIELKHSPFIAVLHADTCTSLKSVTENMVYQIINDSQVETKSDKMSDDSDCDDPVIKKSQCTFNRLAEYYQTLAADEWTLQNSPRKKLKAVRKKRNVVVIFPDFESLNATVLQDFVMVASSYLRQIPFILIFGVATSLDAIHRSLPFKFSSKLSLQVFQSEQSVTYLNTVLENVFLNDNCRFYLSGKSFKFLTDVFLFYDFSVNSFIQGIKFALLEHFYGNSFAVLCYSHTDTSIPDILNQLTHQELEEIRRFNSFRPYVESQDKPTIINLLENDEFLKKNLKTEVKSFSKYLFNFFAFLRCLHSIVHSLPKHPLGKQLRECYAIAVSEPITQTEEYKECMQILQFSSKDEILDHLKKICTILLDAEKESSKFNIDNDVFQKLKLHSARIETASFQANEEIMKADGVFDSPHLSRGELKSKLLSLSKKEKKLSDFEMARNNCIQYLTKLFNDMLKPPQSMPFYEIFFFENVVSLKTHVVGSPRAAIHTALNNPHFYLQCNCCDLSETTNLSILPTMPDISIIYKLHLECGRLINMYDWLQAFVTILDPEGCTDEQTRVLPTLQARFTRAVAELQFLGFIKTSKRKTDHVQRLTWGGS